MLPALFAATLALLPAQDPALLPETPSGWRPERLEFPLSFAPDIELEGYEQLSFAPGVFDPDSGKLPGLRVVTRRKPVVPF